MKKRVKEKIASIMLVSAVLATSLGMTGCGEASNKVSELPTEVQESDAYVEKVTSLPENFIFGADVSSYMSIKKSGVTFYDFDGKEVDDQGFFQLLHDSGVNCIRLRVWNDPYDENGNSYGGGNCDVDNAIAIGKLATEAGMSVQVDFHYSDFWADPKKQMVPKAWEDLDLEAKAEALAQFTEEALQKMLDAKVNVTMVQIGNETTNGIAGESDWTSMGKLFAAGANAVRQISEKNRADILVAIHFADPQNGHFMEYAEELDKAGVDYDVFASSYYPYWHGTIAKLCTILGKVADTYDKKVYVTETSWAYTLADGDGFGNTVSEESNSTDMPYDFTVQGQTTAIALLVKGLAENLGDKCLGVNYWEPAWLGGAYAYDSDGNLDSSIWEANSKGWETDGSGWAASYAKSYDAKDAGQYYGGSAVDNQAWFDFTGHPLESLKTYLYCQTGTTAEKPEILWNEVEEPSAEIEGNLLTNGSFEDQLNGWDVDGFDTQDATSNARAGEGSMHFYAEKAQTYTASQTITLNAGSYTLTGYLEGGDANDGAKFGLGLSFGDGYENSGIDLSESNVKVASDGSRAMSWGSVTSWKDWKELKLEHITIPEDGTEVTVLITVTIDKGCWGAFDDISLILE